MKVLRYLPPLSSFALGLLLFVGCSSFNLPTPPAKPATNKSLVITPTAISIPPGSTGHVTLGVSSAAEDVDPTLVAVSGIPAGLSLEPARFILQPHQTQDVAVTV